MSGMGNGFDLSTTTFSRDGRVFQVEYAGKAVENSGTVLGVQCSDGVVLAVEKLVFSKMLVKGTNQRIYAVDRHAGVALAGMKADGRMLVNRTREEAASYKSMYKELIPGKTLTDRVGGFMHMFTLYWTVRPFGSSILTAVYDADGPQLYQADPNGQVLKYFGSAIGKGRQQAKTELEKLKLGELTCREAVKELAKIIYTVHDDEKDKNFELEMSWVCDESNKCFTKVPANLVEEAEKLAQDALDAA